MKRKGPRKQSGEKAGRPALRMLLVPCSCGGTFAVSEDYDRHGASWSRYLVCPHCGKRHDPRNRLLEMRYHREGYWKVDKC